MSEALRYNSGKIELGLVPTELIEEVAKVMTYGKNKYTVKDNNGNIIVSGANNWRKGLKWMDVVSSLERHLLAFKNGEDFDESGCLHLGHVGANLGFLLNYYKAHPELDNRYRIPSRRVGLDIDDVLADYIPSYCQQHNIFKPKCWSFDPYFKHRYEESLHDPDFWLNLEVKINPDEIPFDPICYITSRPEFLRDVTEQWLFENNFPIAPVVFTQDKASACKEFNLQIFVDDNFDNYTSINNAGINCYLMDCEHNRKFNVGYKRIKSLKDII